jgi:hypothetical protein
MNYTNPEFNFLNQIDIPNAKSIEQPNVITDTINNNIYVLLKMKCTMKQSWEVLDYPFDDQELLINVENSLFDTKSLVFKADTLDSNFDTNMNVDGWTVKNFKVSTGISPYPTAFGFPNSKIHESDYSKYTISFTLERNAFGLFLKIFLGMYIAFLISIVTFILKPDEIEPRFGLPVGGLFAAVGNKYIIDSILPESSSFSLVDSLHSITFLFIFFIIATAAISLIILNRGNPEKARRFDKRGAFWIFFSYVTINAVLITIAIIS